MIKLIISALDGSEHSLKALDVARDLAERYHAKLILLHAYPYTSDLRGSEAFNQLVAERKRAGDRILKEANSRIDHPAFEVEEDLLEGPAADAIIRVAKTRNADLVVMGTRGMGSIKGLLFGSVSIKVSSLAPCAVLVTR